MTHAQQLVLNHIHRLLMDDSSDDHLLPTLELYIGAPVILQDSTSEALVQGWVDSNSFITNIQRVGPLMLSAHKSLTGWIRGFLDFQLSITCNRAAGRGNA